MYSLSDAYEECRVLNKHYGTRFFHAINLFPKELQPHIHGLCAFDRILLEMIRNPKEGVSKKDQIDAMKAWQRAFEVGMKTSLSPNTYLRASVHTTKIFDINEKLYSKIVKARIADHKRASYDNYAQLKRHLDTTSGHISEILCGILEISSPKAKSQIARIARAGELLEIIIDTNYAIQKRNKCYLPKKDLRRYNYPLKDLRAGKVTKNWQELIESYLKKIEADLKAGAGSMNVYPESCQPAILSIVEAYTSLLKDIRAKEYNVFTKQPKLGLSLRLKHYIPAIGSLIR